MLLLILFTNFQILCYWFINYHLLVNFYFQMCFINFYFQNYWYFLFSLFMKHFGFDSKFLIRMYSSLKNFVWCLMYYYYFVNFLIRMYFSLKNSVWCLMYYYYFVIINYLYCLRLFGLVNHLNLLLNQDFLLLQ